MKKIIIGILSLTLVFGLTACGFGGTQEISFQGFNMEIPASWKAESRTLSDDYAVYKKTNLTGQDFQLVLQDTFSLLQYGDLDSAGASFKEFTEDDASYTDVSEPVAGTFAGKYDMHIIECTYHAINVTEDDGESDYPCKLIRIYMDGHDVIIEFITADGAFEAFDEALTNAVCD